MRIEKDFIGQKSIPSQALYGIHSVRAAENFPNTDRFNFSWFRALGMVKKACFLTTMKLSQALVDKYQGKHFNFQLPEDSVLEFMLQSAEEIIQGRHFNEFIVPGISGGAGTSINMNINEIIANRSLLLMGNKPGEYKFVDPVEQANIYQSTNDVVPTALKLSIIQLLVDFEESINQLRHVVEKTERSGANNIRPAYTQLQHAVPSSYARLFSAYNDALSRDWWRVSKCAERIKAVNLGGSAIGTGLAVPRFFVMNVVNELRAVSGLPLSRAENMADNTSNLDSLVEIHGIIKSHAVNLEKMTSDLRLLSSDLNTDKDIELPERQAGSSIMPGKVNPVIVEFTTSVCHRIYANDQLITNLSALGNLELNAYIPVIGHHLLNSLESLIALDKTIVDNLITGLKMNFAVAENKIYKNHGIAMALIPYLGYHKTEKLSLMMKNKKMDIFAANQKLGLLDPEKLKNILKPDSLLKEGFTIKDILENMD
jgi:aspartate ammonia-lyase